MRYMPLNQFDISKVAGMMGLLHKKEEPKPLFVDVRTQAQQNASSLVQQGKQNVAQVIQNVKTAPQRYGFDNPVTITRTPEGKQNVAVNPLFRDTVAGFAGSAMRIKIPQERKKLPVEAFGIGAVPLFTNQKEDEWKTVEENTDWESKGVSKPGLVDMLTGRDKSTVRRRSDREDFRKRIVGAENEKILANGGDLYKSVGVSGDLGKYQLNPSSLKAWSESWLGKNYTPDEFLQNKKAQEDFFKQFLDVTDEYKLTPDEAAIAWHRGWGELGTGPKETREQRFRDRLQKMMSEPSSQYYLTKFNR